MEILILSAIAGLGLLFTLVRTVPYRFLIRHHIWFDVFFTALLPWLFAGSMQGMMIAVFSGITVTVSLCILSIFTPKPT
jgi:hypothetical protein